MKKTLMVMLSVLVSAFSTQAQLIYQDSFDGYGMNTDINGLGDWVATTNGSSFMITTNELLLSKTNEQLLLTNHGISMEPGDSIRMTVDHRVVHPLATKNFRFMSFGVQTNGMKAMGELDESVTSYVSYNNYEYGTVKYNPDADSWWSTPYAEQVNASTVDDCGYSPTGFGGSALDSDSDPLRAIYTVTKSDVVGEFQASLVFSNLTSGVTRNYTKPVITRSAAWAGSSDLHFTLTSDPEASDFDLYLNSVTVEKVAPSAVPTSVSALGLNNEVLVGWDHMAGAVEYDVYRSTTPGVYTTPLMQVTGISYLDTSVANNVTYYYAVEAVYYNGNSEKSDEVTVTPGKIYQNELVADIDFTGEEGYVDGDLANQLSWREVSGSGTNAFNVVTANSAADTVSSFVNFDTVNGNAVYLSRLATNNEDDAWEGYIEMKLSSPTPPGADDFTNQSIFQFGLIDDPATGPLDYWGGAESMALLHVNVRYGGDIFLTFSSAGTDTDDNRLAKLSMGDLGWDPLNDGARETDLVRFSFKIRKARSEGIYQVWGSMSNTVSGAVSEDHEQVRVPFMTKSRMNVYDSEFPLFAMGPHADALKDDVSRPPVNVTLDKVYLAHTINNLPDVVAPVINRVVSEDRGVIFEWDDVLDVTGYTIFMETEGGDDFTLETNYQGTSYNDKPRWNGVTNFYTVRANYDPDLSPTYMDSETVAGLPLALKSMVDLDGAKEDWFEGSWFYQMQQSGLQTNGSWTYMDNTETPLWENGVVPPGGAASFAGGYDLYALSQWNKLDPADLNLSRWNAWAINAGDFYINFFWWEGFEQLAYIKVQDWDFDGAAPSVLDATKTNAYVKLGLSYFEGGNNMKMRVAIRNGDQWYASEPVIAGNNYSGAELRVDVMNSAWAPLTVVHGVPTVVGVFSTDNNASFTEVDAAGFFLQKGYRFTLTEIEIVIDGAEPSYEYWANSMGLVSTNSAVTDDPDADGLINEKEYAFGGDPLVADTATLPQMDMTIQSDPVTSVDAFTYVYMMQNDPVSGVNYVLKETTDLVNQAWVPTEYTETVTPIDYYWSAVTNYVPIEADKRFLKLDLE